MGTFRRDMLAFMFVFSQLDPSQRLIVYRLAAALADTADVMPDASDLGHLPRPTPAKIFHLTPRSSRGRRTDDERVADGIA